MKTPTTVVTLAAIAALAAVYAEARVPRHAAVHHTAASVPMRVGRKLVHDDNDNDNDNDNTRQAGKASAAAAPCEKHLDLLRRKKKIDLEAIGSRPNNQLLEFLRCQHKQNHKQQNTSNTTNNNCCCKGAEKAYAGCHASVMGTGNFNGRKHCGEELERYLDCVVVAANSNSNARASGGGASATTT